MACPFWGKTINIHLKAKTKTQDKIKGWCHLEVRGRAQKGQRELVWKEWRGAGCRGGL